MDRIIAGGVVLCSAKNSQRPNDHVICVTTSSSRLDQQAFNFIKTHF